jgi:ABC-2 type transport system permease protein
MYFAFAKSAFQTEFAYRGQVLAAIFGELVSVFARIAVWSAVMAGGATAAGVTLADMVTYAVLAGTVIGAWNPTALLNGVSRALKSGDVATQLLRPIPYPAYLFATEAGNLAYRTLTVIVPVTLVSLAVYGLKPPASLFHGLAFPLFWGLSFLSLFAFACLGGLVAFWLFTAFSIDWLLRALVLLLGGTFIPLWFFPGWLAGALKLLPFAWIGYYPAAVYLGKLGIAETLAMFALGVGWVALLAAGVALLWSRATMRITVQGG